MENVDKHVKCFSLRNLALAEFKETFNSGHITLTLNDELSAKMIFY